MQKWEYKYLSIEGDGYHGWCSATETDVAFNDLGRDGWELVWMNADGTEARFKRPLAAPTKRDQARMLSAALAETIRIEPGRND